MEQEPVLCFFVTAAKDFFFMIYVVESYVSYHLLIVLSTENGRAVLIRHSQPCQPWKTSSYTISQMCDTEFHLLLIAITSVFRINGAARLCRLFPKGLKKGTD